MGIFKTTPMDESFKNKEKLHIDEYYKIILHQFSRKL